MVSTSRGVRGSCRLSESRSRVAYIEGYMPFDEVTFTARQGREVAALFSDHGVTMRQSPPIPISARRRETLEPS